MKEANDNDNKNMRKEKGYYLLLSFFLFPACNLVWRQTKLSPYVTIIHNNKYNATNGVVLESTTSTTSSSTASAAALVAATEVIASAATTEDTTHHTNNTHAHFEANNSIVYAWMHIQKTGGTTGYESFVIPFSEQYSHTTTIYPPPYQKGTFDFNSPGCAARRRHGGTHCSASELEDCLSRQLYPGKKIKFFTMIRHPVERVISEYFYYQQQAKRWTASMNQVKRNITQWVLDKTNIAHNRQALFFLVNSTFPKRLECISFDGDKTIQYIEDNYGSVEKFNNLALSGSDIVDENRFAFVVLMDDLQASATKFQEKFDVQTRLVASKSHASRKSPVSDDIRRLIEERNRLDMMIYHKVKSALQTPAVTP